MLVNFVSIVACDPAFGLYQTFYDTEVYDDSDLLGGAVGEFYELGSDDVPDWVIDIRGNVKNEPNRVFVERKSEGEVVTYFGLESVEL